MHRTLHVLSTDLLAPSMKRTKYTRQTLPLSISCSLTLSQTHGKTETFPKNVKVIGEKFLPTKLKNIVVVVVVVFSSIARIQTSRPSYSSLFFFSSPKNKEYRPQRGNWNKPMEENEHSLHVLMVWCVCVCFLLYERLAVSLHYLYRIPEFLTVCQCSIRSNTNCIHKQNCILFSLVANANPQ